MNRPEPIELENNLGPDAVTGEINRVPWMAYDVDEMDIYIAELEQKLAEKDKEITRLASVCRAFATERDANQDANYELRKEIESLKASHYAESVDAGMRERRIRRELWLARAWFCGRSSEYFSGMASRCKIGQEDFYREVSERATKYMKLSYKCQARAEKYK